MLLQGISWSTALLRLDGRRCDVLRLLCLPCSGGGRAPHRTGQDPEQAAEDHGQGSGDQGPALPVRTRAGRQMGRLSDSQSQSD